MSKKFKSQASSARAASSTFAFGNNAGFQTASSPLSYVTEQPDVSAISEAKIVVAFKNLGKKDSITKTKALEELQEYVSTTTSDVEGPVLEAWVNIYPRTSIDNSRRVRQLAQSLQGAFTTSAGKRIAPYLPEIIGPWLAGTYDSDKTVSRAAQDAFQDAFPTKEKQQAVWKRYRAALIDYAEDATLRQTPQTLSDERVTSPDDAEAKYVRVVGTAMLVLTRLVQGDRQPESIEVNIVEHKPDSAGTIAGAETISGQDLNDLFREKKLWEFAYHGDPYVRRGTYSLVALCATSTNELDWSLISNNFLGKSLHINQLGSAIQYVEALLAITKAKPTVWTDLWTSKTAVSKRLLQCLRKGSQRGPSSFWPLLAELVQTVPVEVWSDGSSPTTEKCRTLLHALHDGVSQPDEPRSNVSEAWSAYIKTCFWLSDQHSATDHDLLESELVPIITQYVEDTPEKSQWKLPTSTARRVCIDCMSALQRRHQGNLINRMTSNLADHLIEAVKISLPETSRDFKASQDGLIAKARRFAELLDDISKKDDLELGQHISGLNSKIIASSVEILRTRNGKPYGAAGVLQQLLPGSAEVVPDEFVRNDIPRLIGAPAANRLVSVLFACRAKSTYPSALASAIEALTENATLRKTSLQYCTLLGGINRAELEQHPIIINTVLEDLEAGLTGGKTYWESIAAILSNTQLSTGMAVPGSPAALIIGRLMSSLSVEIEQEPALQGIERLLDLPAMHPYLSTFLSRLMILTDSPHQLIADRSANLVQRVRVVAASADSGLVSRSSLQIIAKQLTGEGEPLSVDSLVGIAKEFETSSSDFLAVFPTASHWRRALAPFLDVSPLGVTSIISPLQGVVFAVPVNEPLPETVRDLDDFSLALRLTLYVTQLIIDTTMFEQLSGDQLNGFYNYYPLALHFIDEKLSVDSSNSFWQTSTPEVVDEMVDLLSRGRIFIAQLIRDQATFYRLEGKELTDWMSEMTMANDTQSHTKALPTGNSVPRRTLQACWEEQMYDNIRDTGARSYNLGVTLVSVMSEFVDAGGLTSFLHTWEHKLRSVHSSEDLVLSAAILAVLRDSLASSAQGKRICNELIASATELNDLTNPLRALRPLVLMNILLEGDAVLLESIPTQRVMFLTKNLVKLLDTGAVRSIILSEIFKMLYHIIGSIAEMYGEHWEKILQTLHTLWGRENDLDRDLPTLHASLRLYSRLRSLTKQEPNEDLVEAWQSALPALTDGLLEVLQSFEEPSHGANQPRAITTGLLERQLHFVELPAEKVPDVFPLLSSGEQPVQNAAFALLHKAIPKVQQQVSLDVVLEKKDAHLPEELLSLLLHAPTMQILSNTHESRDVIWLGIRRYFLSWEVVLDHFVNASYKLQELYAADIKDNGSLPALLDFICDILRITSGRPLAASKFEVTRFEVGEEDSLEKEAQWLSIHLYYLCLLRLPSLAKDWFIEQKNRIKSPLESWTQKHISPLLVTSALATVSDWCSTQDSDDRPVTVKTSPRSAELVASIAIDEESPPISLAIALPGAYPFEQAVVTSRYRVGVSDKNWQSWLRTFQVIIFSSGSLVEGLMAFRRNVQGALKGQSECAICYSIIGTDMQTPNKKCGTCNNIFHGACLFRWFKSSNSSTCPLCRNSFSYA